MKAIGGGEEDRRGERESGRKGERRTKDEGRRTQDAGKKIEGEKIEGEKNRETPCLIRAARSATVVKKKLFLTTELHCSGKPEATEFRGRVDLQDW